MDPLVNFSIPFRGLQDGIHQYTFKIDNTFFAHFEHSPIQEGNIVVNLRFDKRPDMLILDFGIKGDVKTNCDRCLAAIDLPIQSEAQLVVKFGDKTSEEADLIYIAAEVTALNVSKYIYEYICLALPIVKIYDCDQEKSRPCNEEVLRHLIQEDKSESKENPLWNALKNFKDN